MSPGSISVIDTITNSVVATIPVGSYPSDVAITPDGTRAYVTNQEGTISVIDTISNNVVGFPISVGINPTDIAITPDGKFAYVTDFSSSTISILDTATNMLVGSPISVGLNPTDVAITPDGKLAYVTSNSKVSVIDTVSKIEVSSIIAENCNGIAITPDGKFAYIANFYYGAVSVIDTSSNMVVATIPFESGSLPINVAITSDGKFAYVTDENNDTVWVINTNTKAIVDSPIHVGDQPWGIAITPIQVELDNFNRANGRLGANWGGYANPNNYRIVNNRVNVRQGGPIYWKPNTYGVNQEAFVTLSTVNPSGYEHGLMLKVQSGKNAANYQRGVINVDYRARDNTVLVSTMLPNRPWKDYPLLNNVTFSNGDKLSARVYGDGPNAGTVHVFKNGAEIGVVALDRVDKAFFNPRGGSIGLWFGDAYGAVFDNFGGGNL